MTQILDWDDVKFIEKNELENFMMISLFSHNDNAYISLDKVYPELEEIEQEFKGIKFIENTSITLNDGTAHKITIIKIEDNEAAEDIYRIISEAIMSNFPIIKKIEKIKNCLERSQARMEELRGYIGEMLYLINNPKSKKAYGKDYNGKKTELSYDIVDGGNHIEVKSFHPASNKIKMSLYQFKEKNKKVAIPVINDQNSDEAFTTRQLAEKIEVDNYRFYNEILEKYQNNNKFLNMKWRLEIPFDITDQIDSDFDWPAKLDDETTLCIKIDKPK